MNIILKLGNCNLVPSSSAKDVTFFKFPPYTIVSFEREDIFENRRHQQNIKQLVVKSACDRMIFIPNTNMCWLDSSILYDFDTDALVILRTIKHGIYLTIVNNDYKSKPIIDKYTKKLLDLSINGQRGAVLITSEIDMGRVIIEQVVEVEDVQQYLSLALDQEEIAL